MKVTLVKAEGLRRVLVALFYAAYIFTMAYSLRHAAPADREIYIVMLILAPFGIWCEVVRFFYTRANDALNENCDPERCLKLLHFVRCADILHMFQYTAPYLQGFATLDLNQLDKVEPQLSKALAGQSASKYMGSFEYRYLMFSVYAENGDREQMNEHYDALGRIINAGKRTAADVMSLRQLLCGIYQLKNGKNEDAATAFENVNPEALKPRMRAYYHFYIAQLLQAVQQQAQAKDAYQKAVALAPRFLLIAEQSI